MKWIDRPGVREMERGGVYEIDRKKRCQESWNVTEMDKIL